MERELPEKPVEPTKPFDALEEFEEFLRTFYTSSPERRKVFRYKEQIEEIVATTGNVLVVFLDDLMTHDPKLAYFLQENPMKAMDDFTEAFKNIMRMYGGGKLSHEDYFVRLTAEDFQLPPFYCRMRELRGKNLDRIVCTTGIVLQQTPLLHLLTEAVFECGDCGHQFSVPQFQETLLKPVKCLNPGCKNKNKFVFVREDSKTIDYQKIRLQEPQEELPSGDLPKNLIVVLTADLVHSVKPGDRVHVFGGFFLSEFKKSPSGGSSTILGDFVMAYGIINFDDDKTQLELSDGEIEEIRKRPAEWKQEEEEFLKSLPEEERVSYEFGWGNAIHRKLAYSVTPSVVGMEHIKLAICLWLFGGVPKIKPDETWVRGTINILVIGDPGLGKSMMLESACRLPVKCHLTTGTGSTGVGLTAALIDDREMGKGKVLQAGPFVLADGGHLGIDEFEKMNVSDRKQLHTVMAQQYVKINKAGFNVKLNTRTATFGTANPIKDRFDPKLSARVNIGLPAAILSREDLIFVEREKQDERLDNELADFILDMHTNCHPKAGRTLPANEDERVQEESKIPFSDTDFVYPTEDFRKYLYYAQRYVHPILSPEAKAHIKAFYLKWRKPIAAKAKAEEEEEKEKEKKKPQPAISITGRFLEAIIRCAEAHARMELSDTVTEENAKFVCNLMEVSLAMIGFDEDKAVFDIDRVETEDAKLIAMQMRTTREVLRDLTLELNGKSPYLNVLMDRLGLEELLAELEEVEIRALLRKMQDRRMLHWIEKKSGDDIIVLNKMYREMGV